jgi:hypothetical protein
MATISAPLQLQRQRRRGIVERHFFADGQKLIWQLAAYLL